MPWRMCGPKTRASSGSPAAGGWPAPSMCLRWRRSNRIRSDGIWKPFAALHPASEAAASWRPQETWSRELKQRRTADLMMSSRPPVCRRGSAMTTAHPSGLLWFGGRQMSVPGPLAAPQRRRSECHRPRLFNKITGLEWQISEVHVQLDSGISDKAVTLSFQSVLSS
jgi:hypothetical protein